MMNVERVSVELVELLVLVASQIAHFFNNNTVPVSRRSLPEKSAILCVLIVLSNLC